MQGPSCQSDIREVEAHLSKIQTTAGHGGLEFVSCPENQVEKSKDQSRWITSDASKHRSEQRISGDVMVIASKPEMQVPGNRQ